MSKVPELSDEFQAVKFRHFQINNGKIRAQRLDHLQSGNSVRALPDDPQLWI